MIKKPVQTSALPAQVRVIGGTLRGSRLPVANKPGLRPTPDRVRETLFNWLGQSLAGWHCVDSFAGTGALGFEAVSRGAVHVQMAELDPQLVASLQQTATRLQVQALVSIRRTDGLAHLMQLPIGSVDIVFLDPPFDSTLLEKALVAAAKSVKMGGWVYAESPKPVAESLYAGAGLVVYRQLQAGQVVAQLFQRCSLS